MSPNVTLYLSHDTKATFNSLFINILLTKSVNQKWYINLNAWYYITPGPDVI